MTQSTLNPPRTIEDDTRAIFGRVLEGWAMDCLKLRRAGLDRPSARPGDGMPVRTPGPRLADGPMLERWSPDIRPRWERRAA